MRKVWVIDDDRSMRWVLERALRNAGLEVVCFSDAETALAGIADDCPDAVLSDIRMPGLDGIGLLKRLHEEYPALPIIIMTAHSDLESAVSAYQEGAFEYLPKPFDIDDAIVLIERALKQSPQTLEPQPAASTMTAWSAQQPIIGEAPAMQEVFRVIGRLAHSHMNVLINGESGTGKELVARALHEHSPRAKQPFIALNMAAIPKDLVESELFGHTKGAFTGAVLPKQGRFEQANGGTLFLDEIGDMQAETQTRLLRVLSSGEFFCVGGRTPIKVDVRIIAATHQHLEALVAKGLFREDLYHRLNVIRIHIPRLADRREDIPRLLDYFLSKVADELRVEKKSLSDEALECLIKNPWPGNVRQLENSCRWLTVMASGRDILLSDLPQELLQHEAIDLVESKQNWENPLRLWATQALAKGEQRLLDIATPRFERIMIEAALAQTGGRKRDAAELLGWGRNTLTRKLKELDVHFADD
jgi:two-component system nitrogen regulation response regulator GlnG